MTTNGLSAEIKTFMREGTTLSPRWYVDDEIFRVEKQTIFARSWQFACHVDQVANPGDLFPVQCGDVPIVVVRDGDGELRAFVNVCRHRGHEVVQAPCNRSTMQCRYHGWTFGLDGELRAAPRERREERPFDRSRFPLFKAQVGTWGPFVFVNPDPTAEPFDEVIRSVNVTAERFGLDLSNLTLRDSKEYRVRCNWKLAVDNMLECYHCPTGHPGFNAYYNVDPENYLIELHGLCSYQRGDLRDKPEAKAKKDDWGDFELYFIWPNTVIVPGPVSCMVMPLRPVEPGLTIFNPITYFRADVDDATAAPYIEYYDEIWSEDVELVESVHRGQESLQLPWGPFFRDSEKLLQHVQALLLEGIEAGPLDRSSDDAMAVAG